MPGKFTSPAGDLENIHVNSYDLINQNIGGSLWMAGLTANGMSGNIGNAGDKSSPIQVTSGGTNWIQVVSRGESGAGLLPYSANQNQLYLWGDNSQGQLGDNTVTTRSSPVQTVAGGTNWKQVSLGTTHAAAIKTDGTLWTWGFNSSGQLGNNDRTKQSSPVQTVAGGNNWKFVSCGGAFTAAIKTDGTLWSWGFNSSGQLGVGDNSNRSSPTQIFAGGTDWKQLACGDQHAAAIKNDNKLYVWGNGGFGKLGRGDTTSQNTPVQTAFFNYTDWRQVSCGLYHTAVIKTDGTLYVMGYNFPGLGFLGVDAFAAANQTIPTTTLAGGNNWREVSCGDFNTSGIKTDGTLWVWGDNQYGQLGTNDLVNRSSAIQTVAGGNNWKQVSSGNYRNFAIHFYDADNQYPSA